MNRDIYVSQSSMFTNVVGEYSDPGDRLVTYMDFTENNTRSTRKITLTKHSIDSVCVLKRTRKSYKFTTSIEMTYHAWKEIFLELSILIHEDYTLNDYHLPDCSKTQLFLMMLSEAYHEMRNMLSHHAWNDTKPEKSIKVSKRFKLEQNKDKTP